MPLRLLALEYFCSPELPPGQLHRVSKYRHIVARGERDHGPRQPVHSEVALVRLHERGVVDPRRGGDGRALEQPPPPLVDAPWGVHGDGHGAVLACPGVAHALLVGPRGEQQLPHADVDVQAHDTLPPDGGRRGGVNGKD